MDIYVLGLLIFAVSLVCLALFGGDIKYKKTTGFKAHPLRGQSSAEDNLENLYRIQRYEFWRNFGEQGEQAKKK